jgi:hypothetical protein
MGLMETGPIRLDTLKICPQLLRYYLNKSYPKMRKKPIPGLTLIMIDRSVLSP